MENKLKSNYYSKDWFTTLFIFNPANSTYNTEDHKNLCETINEVESRKIYNTTYDSTAVSFKKPQRNTNNSNGKISNTNWER